MSHNNFVSELCSILVKNQVIKKDEADALVLAFKKSEKPQFDVFLLDEGLVSRQNLLNALNLVSHSHILAFCCIILQLLIN